MRILFLTFILIGSVISSDSAKAYVFNMHDAKFGSYLKSTYAPWGNSQDPWSQSSGPGLTWSDQFTNIWSYEFGFLYNTSAITWRFGVEIIQPPQLNGVIGSDAATSTPYYSMLSSVSAVVPKLGMEINLRTWQESRIWAYVEYGLANLTLQNSYNFTAAGAAKYVISNFREEIKSIQANYLVSLGYEVLMSDTTTISLELGYRWLAFSNLTHNVAVTNFQGPVMVGDPALQNGGVTARNLNMNGAYAGLNLRFWVY